MRRNEIELLETFTRINKHEGFSKVTREEIGKSLNINKWTPSCFKHPRVFRKYVLGEHP